MSKPTRKRSNTSAQHSYPREARLNQSLRQVIAEALTAIDDEQLDLVTITSIDVDAEMNRAIVFFDSLRGEEGDSEILEGLARHRVRLQSMVARQIRSKKTPILEFRPDEVIRAAERIERILREHPSPAVLDTATLDTATLDTATVDGATNDGATNDGATNDGATNDGATNAAGNHNAGNHDAGNHDAGSHDAGSHGEA